MMGTPTQILQYFMRIVTQFLKSITGFHFMSYFRNGFSFKALLNNDPVMLLYTLFKNTQQLKRTFTMKTQKSENNSLMCK